MAVRIPSPSTLILIPDGPDAVPWAVLDDWTAEGGDPAALGAIALDGDVSGRWGEESLDITTWPQVMPTVLVRRRFRVDVLLHRRESRLDHDRIGALFGGRFVVGDGRVVVIDRLLLTESDLAVRDDRAWVMEEHRLCFESASLPPEISPASR